MPENHELTVKTGTASLDACVQQVIDEMIRHGFVPSLKLGLDIGNKP